MSGRQTGLTQLPEKERVVADWCGMHADTLYGWWSQHVSTCTRGKCCKDVKKACFDLPVHRFDRPQQFRLCTHPRNQRLDCSRILEPLHAQICVEQPSGRQLMCGCGCVCVQGPGCDCIHFGDADQRSVTVQELTEAQSPIALPVICKQCTNAMTLPPRSRIRTGELMLTHWDMHPAQPCLQHTCRCVLSSMASGHS